MIGFVLGTVCLIALIGLLMRRRYGYHAMAHGPWGHGWHDHGHGSYAGGYRSYRSCGGGGFHGPGRRRAALHMLLERLDTTPGQDKAVSGALSDAAERLREIREPLRELRGDLADAMQRDVFDRAYVDSLFTRGEGRLREARGAAIEALERVHAALEPEQRKQLGKLLRDWNGFGPRNW